MLLLSTTPMVTMAMARVTPGSILPRNDFRRAASLLHHETTAAIRDIVVIATGEDVPRNIPGATTPTIDGQAAIASALQTLLDDGIVTPLQAFHAHVIDNPQDRRIAKATQQQQQQQIAWHRPPNLGNLLSYRKLNQPYGAESFVRSSRLDLSMPRIF
jgi:hypothetical protein